MIEKIITLKIKAENIDCFLHFINILRHMIKKYLIDEYLIKDIDMKF